MTILRAILAALLLVALQTFAVTAAPAENRASGSASDPSSLIESETRLSERSVRENIALDYDIASDDAVAARVGAALGQGFRSHSALTRALGPAGPGRQWHHIVEQTPGNIGRFGAEAIHNTGNVVRLDATNNGRISGFYSSIQPFTGGQTVRQWLGTQSFDEQVRFGLDTLRRFGVGP
ncbi:MAG: hypothetical protein R3F58_16330 [Steroidobacteraceae bacterium]